MRSERCRIQSNEESQVYDRAIAKSDVGGPARSIGSEKLPGDSRCQLGLYMIEPPMRGKNGEKKLDKKSCDWYKFGEAEMSTQHGTFKNSTVTPCE